MSGTVKIAVVADRDPSFRPHLATDEALAHAADRLGIELAANWIGTEQLDTNEGWARLQESDGVFVAPGSPYRSLSGALAAIRFAREQMRPLLGTCAGFQHVVLEYARNVLGFADAQHAEYDPNASLLFIARLECSLVGRELPITVRDGSRAAALYGRSQVSEQYYCNFGVNPQHVAALTSGALRAVGSDAEGEVRIVELSGHPFFLATLFLPQFRSLRELPHPLVLGFLQASVAAQKDRKNAALPPS
jgi:CTP synthase (UTP-ammonia lyase)